MSVHSKYITQKIVGEIPIGIINSINTDFLLANIPISDTIEVILNGLIQQNDEDYTITDNIITFTKAPRTNSIVLVNYEF